MYNTCMWRNVRIAVWISFSLIPKTWSFDHVVQVVHESPATTLSYKRFCEPWVLLLKHFSWIIWLLRCLQRRIRRKQDGVADVAASYTVHPWRVPTARNSRNYSGKQLSHSTTSSCSSQRPSECGSNATDKSYNSNSTSSFHDQKVKQILTQWYKWCIF